LLAIATLRGMAVVACVAKSALLRRFSVGADLAATGWLRLAAVAL
jgi:hypothetical protein